MIAVNVDDAYDGPRLTQQFLHDVVVLLRPVPALFQAPAVHDIADEIDRLGIVDPQEIKKQIRLTALGAKVEVRHEHCADFAIRGSSIHGRHETWLHISHVTGERTRDQAFQSA